MFFFIDKKIRFQEMIYILTKELSFMQFMAQGIKMQANHF